MTRANRLFQLQKLLRDENVHTAQSAANLLNVTPRTIYRDIETLRAAGVRIDGTPGTGYRARFATTLAPMTLEADELEALNLGIAILSEATDPDLASAAQRLGDKVDAALPQYVSPDGVSQHFDELPHANMALGMSFLGTLRAAIKARQKVAIDHQPSKGRIETQVIHPLKVEYWGRIWTLIGWSQTSNRFTVLRLDVLEAVRPLPELFADHPGQRLRDYEARSE